MMDDEPKQVGAAMRDGMQKLFGLDCCTLLILLEITWCITHFAGAFSMCASDVHGFRIRTVTAFVFLEGTDFSPCNSASGFSSLIQEKVDKCAKILRGVENELSTCGYEVQTVRVVTNPFGEWLSRDVGSSSDSPLETARTRLGILDSELASHDISFCALGPAMNAEETNLLCAEIVRSSPRFSCSASVAPADVHAATAAAECILRISRLGDPEHVAMGLGNFRFCAAASCKPFIPFFPGAKSASIVDASHDAIGIALGLENGGLAKNLMKKTQSVKNIGTTFKRGIEEALLPLQKICRSLSKELDFHYIGIDSSLNPSLDEGGSVAEAIEELVEVSGGFGGPGTIAAASAITMALQSLAIDPLTGYCGLMLPLCEDRRLAQLASCDNSILKISNLLSISSVCGVGVDTVPVPGDSTVEELTSLILDVAGIAGRWDKSLSVRVFPVVGRTAGDFTTFDSPYMCNSRILPID